MIGSGISWSVLIKSGLVSFLGLGIVVLVVKLGLEQLFRFISLGRSKGQGSDSFVALSILILSGVLLAETNFRSQLEEDIRPIKGLLLGLFFVTTGAQVNLDILAANWDVALLMLVGLVSVKSLVTAAAGRAAGLSPSEAVRTGFILAQGGEFAFVVLALASQLRVLPAELNQLLIAVVILSMFLTPGREALGVRLGELAEGYFRDGPAPGGVPARGQLRRPRLGPGEGGAGPRDGLCRGPGRLHAGGRSGGRGGAAPSGGRRVPLSSAPRERGGRQGAPPGLPHAHHLRPGPGRDAVPRAPRGRRDPRVHREQRRLSAAGSRSYGRHRGVRRVGGVREQGRGGRARGQGEGGARGPGGVRAARNQEGVPGPVPRHVRLCAVE